MTGSRERTMIAAMEKKIEELTRELDMLRAERDRLSVEARKWAEERDRLHEEAKELKLEAGSLKEKRDALNQEVHRLKNLRQEALESCRAKIDELKILRQKIKEIASKKPRRSSKSLEDEVKDIEWGIQTESLSLDEERNLVEKVRSLESQLQVYRELEDLKDRIEKLENQAEKSRAEISIYRQKVSETADQSQGFHEKMVGRLEKIRTLKGEADEKHKGYLDRREKAKVLHQRYLDISGQIRAIREEIRKKEEEEKAKLQADLRDRLEKEALDKLKRGGKLTFEEFKILAEQGKI